ncbi:MAG: ABC transporter substrate-binding protein [Pseudonocardia sp.]
MRLRTTVRAVAATVMALLLATACGAQSLSEDAPAPADAANVELDTAPAEDRAADVINAIAPDPELTAAVPADVRSEGLKMTTSPGYPPMEMIGTDGTTLIGLDPSLGRAIARKLGVRITIADEDFNAQIPGIVTGRYDILMSSMTDTAERRTTVSFVDYVRAGAGIITQRGNPAGIATPADLCGKTVSVVDNGSSLELAERYHADCTAAGKPGLDILKFPGDQEALLQVTGGRAQANITDYVVASYKAADAQLNVEAIAIEGTETLWGIAMNPQNEQLIQAVKGAVDALMADGEYARILQAWGLDAIALDGAIINGGE